MKLSNLLLTAGLLSIGVANPIATVSRRQSSGIPTHALIGYLHTSFENGSGYISMANVPDEWDIIALAFAVSSSVTSGQIQFQRCNSTTCPGAESDAEFLAAIKAKQAAGKKVIISIGGADGEVQLTTAGAATNFVNSVSAIIDQWGLDGLDVDFEGHSLYLNSGDNDLKNPTTPVIVNLISALKTLASKYGPGFVLTMAPETFFVQLGYQFYGPGPNGLQDPRAGSYLPVIDALRNELSVLQVQEYNSGPIMGLDNQYHTMGSADFSIAMMDMLKAGFAVPGTNQTFAGLDGSQLAIGLPADGQAGNGYITPSAVKQVLQCLVQGTNCGSYTLRGSISPNLRGLMTWSINWDGFSNWEFMNQNGGFLKSLGGGSPTTTTTATTTSATTTTTTTTKSTTSTSTTTSNPTTTTTTTIPTTLSTTTTTTTTTTTSTSPTSTACVYGEWRCSGVYMQQCLTGGWTARATCAAGQTCQGGSNPYCQ